MSWQAAEAVMMTSHASSTARLLLMVIATFADEQGEAWPSVETISTRAALSERQTRTTLQALVKAGELVIVRPGGGRQTTTKYLMPHLARLETLRDSADTLRPTAVIKPEEKVRFGVNTLRDSVKRVQSSADTLRPTAPEPLEPSIEPSTTTTAAHPTPRPVPAKASKPKAEPKDPTAFQLLFESLALTCYGGHDDLTAPASSRIGSAAKVLLAANYTGPDVPLIAAWISTQEKWRTGTLSPQTIAERAPAWKQGLKANPGRMPKANELDDQDWDAEAARADERNRFLGGSAAGWN